MLGMLSSAWIALGLAAGPAGDTPAWNPQAADLLFTSSRDGNAEIYLLPAGQAEWVNLTNHPSGDNWPVWSPDGKRIAFQSKRAGNLDVWVMAADGSNPVQLTDNPEPDYLPSWSPDGEAITFTSWRVEREGEERASHIYTMKADGSGQRRLVAASLNTSEGAVWSPDGKRIVYARRGEKGADLVVADRDGTNERQITHDQDQNIYHGSPSFSPDGTTIAFYSDNEGVAALTLIRVDGSERRTVRAEGHNWYPRWSPDGRWLVYTTAAAGGDEGNTDILAVPASGEGEPLLLVGGPKRELEGSWRGR